MSVRRNMRENKKNGKIDKDELSWVDSENEKEAVKGIELKRVGPTP